MKIKGITEEDFVNYKIPSMYICTNTCTFKCDKECGVSCCQNSSLANQPSIDVSDDTIIKRYIRNPITGAIVFGGLEPFDQFEELYRFVLTLRKKYKCNDTVVIYTGYNKEEVLNKISRITNSDIKNIIIKFGRFIPNDDSVYDEILGVNLASKNQYSEYIS